MNWNSLSDFLAMGGYGLYVWGSVVVTAVLMALEPLMLQLRRKSALAQLKRENIIKQELQHEKSA